MKYVAKTLYGFEDILASELKALGAESISILNRAVEFHGSGSLLYRVNYNSRLALSVLQPVTEFSIAGQKDLYNAVVSLEWDRYLDPSMTFAVTAVVNSPHFAHSGYAALVVKDAIADFFRRLTMKRPSVDHHSPDLLVNLHISNNNVTISLDSTVVPLYRRGYRRGQTEASLNEVLAAGLITLAGWRAETPLADGMCGSGTIVAEAGLTACNISPGKFRKEFGFMKWKDYDPAAFRSVRFDAEKKERKSPVRIFAGDISPEAVRIACMNIRSAGLGDVVEVSESDFFTNKPPFESGTLIMNPPYGHRLGGGDMNQFYSQIGSALKHKYMGYIAWIFSGNLADLKAVALKPFRKFELLNGDIECCLSGYELYHGSRKGTFSHTH